MNHEIYIKRCIELAQKAIGKTYPNPMVGSVIVHNGKIIGEGYHRKAGEPHAEINAINSVKNPSLLPQSTVYVSLEPCAHFGKTPPCAVQLKKTGFKKVIIGSLDSHEKVNGKGKQIIENSGIEVEDGILGKECRTLNKRFFTFHEKKRPFIILKWAQSQDGFMDLNFKPYAISNKLVNQFVHQMRAHEHSILIGTQTALNDNPDLTTRNIHGKNPVRILIDFDLCVPSHFNIFNNKSQTLVFNSVKNETCGNIKFIKTDKENFLNSLLTKLYEEQIQSVIIEGGGFTLQQFIDRNLWDEAVVITNNHLILERGTQAPVLNSKADHKEKFRDNSIFFHTNKCFFNSILFQSL